MILGTSQIEITPKPGSELSGFAARTQPSVGVIDPLFAKALYLVSGESRLLWIHCDLIGFDHSIVLAFRHWAQEALGLQRSEVMLSATHTHAGPSTIYLREAGQYDTAYVEFLQARLREAAEMALARTENVELVTVEGHLHLAVDRRKTASPHTDPRVAGLGFRRADGRFAAAIVNYAIHPVALGPANRYISADIPGQTARTLALQLPGNPVVLITNGACANLNPPAENVPFAEVQQWGEQIANAVAQLLSKALPAPKSRLLRVISRTVPLPLDTLDAKGINAFADKALRNAGPLAEWGDKYRRVVEHWRSTLLGNGNLRANGHHEAELFGVRLDDVILIGANAEVFSEFTDLLRRHSDKKVYLIGYANGDLGYLPSLAAYDEGGYEVDVAHIFYGGFRARAGGLELLAAAGVDLVASLQVKSPNLTDAPGQPPPHPWQPSPAS